MLSAGSKRAEKKIVCSATGQLCLRDGFEKIALKRHFQNEGDPSSSLSTGYLVTSGYPVIWVHRLWALGMGEQEPWVQPTSSAGPVTLGEPLAPPKPVCLSVGMGVSGGWSCFCEEWALCRAAPSFPRRAARRPSQTRLILGRAPAIPPSNPPGLRGPRRPPSALVETLNYESLIRGPQPATSRRRVPASPDNSRRDVSRKAWVILGGLSPTRQKGR